VYHILEKVIRFRKLQQKVDICELKMKLDSLKLTMNLSVDRRLSTLKNNLEMYRRSKTKTELVERRSAEQHTIITFVATNGKPANIPLDILYAVSIPQEL